MSVKCNLILDSCCDLPFAVIDREGIDLIEFPYIVGDQEYEDDLYRSRSCRDFFESMRRGAKPTTAQISVSTLQESFERAAACGVPTVYISFSSGLSGSFDVAEMVLAQTKAKHPEAELYIVDSRLASVAEGLLAYEAIRQRDRGMTAKELAEWACEARNYVDAEFMVDDLESLKRGGRIPSSVAYAGSKLDVKPLLTFDMEGKLSLIGVARGRKKGTKQLAEYYEKRSVSNGPGKCVVIAHADCEKDAERLKEMLEKQDENILFLESYIGPVIGSHVGPGMIAVVFWGNDRREELSVADKIARRIKGSQSQATEPKVG